MFPGVSTEDNHAAQDNGGRIPIAAHYHRGRHLRPALRAGARARPGDGRVPDDQPPPSLPRCWPGRRGSWSTPAAQVRLRRRLRRRAGHETSPRQPVSAVVTEIGDVADVGFHGREPRPRHRQHRHRRPGRRHPDRRLRTSLRRRRGRHVIEAFIGVCDKLGWRTGVDFLQVVDASEDVIRPAMPEECRLDRMTLMMGYAGVYSYLPQAHQQRRRPLRRQRREDPAGGRAPQADRRPGGPADGRALMLKARGRQGGTG